MYADWANQYDADVTSWGYMTPSRIATALRRHMPDTRAPILDFGCGAGLSGVELAKAGFEVVDGTDISADMIELAKSRGVYRENWLGRPGKMDFAPGDYTAVTAMGVISMGAAPPETLRMVLGGLAPGGLLALSYNDATLVDQGFLDVLTEVQDDGTATMIFDEYGDHLTQKGMKSRVYILEKA